MRNYNNKSLEELEEIKENYIKQYIGDFDKPFNYKQELNNLNKLILSKKVNNK